MVPKSASAFCILKGPKNLHFVVTWAEVKIQFSSVQSLSRVLLFVTP